MPDRDEGEEIMIEIDQEAKSIILSFDCPRCGQHVALPVTFPQEDLSADTYSESVRTDYLEFECFSCKKEHFQVHVSAGQGDKSVTITNIGSPHPLDEEKVEIIITKSI